MDIPRTFQNLSNYLKPNKVLLVYGPRQAGKTTLLRKFLDKSPLKYKLDSGDNIDIQHVLSSQNFELIKEYAKNKALVVENKLQAKKLKKFNKMGVVAQTTQDFNRVNEILKILEKRFYLLKKNL